MILLPILIIGVICQSLDTNVVPNTCVTKSTCRECIQTKGCAWCLRLPSEDNSTDKARCFQPSLYSHKFQCAEEYTLNPDSEQMIIIQEELTRSRGKSGGGGAGYEEGYEYEASQSGGSSYRESHRQEFGSSTSMRGSGHRRIVQISPQVMNLKLRISMFLILFVPQIDFADIYFFKFL